MREAKPTCKNERGSMKTRTERERHNDKKQKKKKENRVKDSDMAAETHLTCSAMACRKNSKTESK
jgi:hypothetical protein